MSMQKEILNHVIDIKSRVGAIEEHLKTLNGRMGKCENSVDGHDKRIDAIDRRLAYYAGGFFVLAAVIQIGINHFF